MHSFQVWLVSDDRQASRWSRISCGLAWAWPIAESLHFLGLCLLIGCIGTFDLRLLGLARRVPIATVHRFVPWGIAGFAINISTGSLFLMTEPDQYIYNPSFHLKLLFLTIGGLNAATFYLTSYRQVFGDRRRSMRRACQSHRGHFTMCVDRRHHRRPSAHVLSSDQLHRRPGQPASDLRSGFALTSCHKAESRSGSGAWPTAAGGRSRRSVRASGRSSA